MLARFVTETSHSTLPAEVIAAAKVGILDGIANMVAAATQPLAGIVVDYLTQLGGKRAWSATSVWRTRLNSCPTW